MFSPRGLTHGWDIAPIIAALALKYAPLVQFHL